MERKSLLEWALLALVESILLVLQPLEVFLVTGTVTGTATGLAGSPNITVTT